MGSWLKKEFLYTYFCSKSRSLSCLIITCLSGLCPQAARTLNVFLLCCTIFRQKSQCLAPCCIPLNSSETPKCWYSLWCHEYTRGHPSLTWLEVCSEMEAVWGRDCLFCFFEVQMCCCVWGGTSLLVQWLKLQASTARGLGFPSIVWELRSHLPSSTAKSKK